MAGLGCPSVSSIVGWCKSCDTARSPERTTPQPVELDERHTSDADCLRSLLLGQHRHELLTPHPGPLNSLPRGIHLRLSLLQILPRPRLTPFQSTPTPTASQPPRSTTSRPLPAPTPPRPCPAHEKAPAHRTGTPFATTHSRRCRVSWTAATCVSSTRATRPFCACGPLGSHSDQLFHTQLALGAVVKMLRIARIMFIHLLCRFRDLSRRGPAEVRKCGEKLRR